MTSAEVEVLGDFSLTFLGSWGLGASVSAVIAAGVCCGSFSLSPDPGGLPRLRWEMHSSPPPARDWSQVGAYRTL